MIMFMRSSSTHEADVGVRIVRFQSATATVRAFESLDLVAPTVQALERVVAHQQKRKLPLGDFLNARVCCGAVFHSTPHEPCHDL